MTTVRGVSLALSFSLAEGVEVVEVEEERGESLLLFDDRGVFSSLRGVLCLW